MAGEVRARGERMRARCHAVDWNSAAADAFRTGVDGDAAMVFRSAAELERAAAVLAEHAEVVRQRSAQIRAIEQAATGWFQEQLTRLEGLAGEITGVAAVPPWREWPWGPGNLPAHGDQEWLEVGEFMRRQGVPV